MNDTPNHEHAMLIEVRACSEARIFCRQYPTLDEAWTKCEHADWLLWFAAKRNVKRETLVLIACECARQALPFTKDPRVLKCIETTEAWARGEVMIDKVREARAYAAAYAYAADAAAYAAAAAYADDAAAYAYAADAAAAYAYAYAADAAAYAYAAYAAAAYAAAAYAADDDDAAAAARKEMRQRCAKIVRKHLPTLP